MDKWVRGGWVDGMIFSAPGETLLHVCAQKNLKNK